MTRPAMTRHIGIAAVTAEGAALCYRTIAAEGQALLGRHRHPEITLHSPPLRTYTRLAEAGDWKGVGAVLLDSALILAAAGADFAVCPANTIHQGLDLVRERSPLPWVHIAEAVADEAERQGLGRLLVLGTRWLMEGPVYPRRLTPRGLEGVVPEADERARLDRLIFEEMIHGRFTDEARGDVRRLIEAGARRGCDGVVFACTELPLLLATDDLPLPVLDSTRLLARAALREAVGERAGAAVHPEP